MPREKVLVTGANGFVAGRLRAELVRRNFSAIAAARGFEGFNHQGESISISTVDSGTDWTEALMGVKVVIHLAARVHVMHDNASDPLTEYLEVNLHGTSNLARQAAKSGVKRFIYVSSVKVNGEYTNTQAFTETNQPNPQDPYAISKWQAEQALREISREIGMEVVIVRPPLVYGPGVKANFYRLMELINKALPIPLASIRNRRSMVYVGNLVDALILCATHPAAAGHTYLVSDGEEVSTPQLVQALAIALHKPSRVFPLPLVLMRNVAKLFGKSAAIDRLTQSLVVDSSKIRNELGWQPPYTIAQGLQATADWYLQSVKSGRS
jgi:UDP-N-acetyl-alpha-D-quinovosamine dehydrogenase